MAKKKSAEESSVVVTDNGDAIYSPPQEDNGESQAKTAQKPRDKRESFMRLADKRTGNALKALERIIPLANGAAYSYTDEEAKAIVGVLRTAIADVERAFSGQKKSRPTFSLRSLTTTNGSASQAQAGTNE